MQPPPGLGPCVLRPWGPPPFRLPGSGAAWSLPREGAATVRGLSFHHRSTTCSCGNRKTRTQPPAPAPCARLPCGSPAAAVRVRVRLAPRAGLCSAQPRCDLLSRRLVWLRDHVLDYQVSPPRCMPLLAFREAWPAVSAGLLSVSAPAPPAGDTWSRPAPAPTPWGQSRGARPAPPPPGASASSVSRGISSTKGMDPCNLPLSFWNVPGQGHSQALSIIPSPCPSSPLSVGL